MRHSPSGPLLRNEATLSATMESSSSEISASPCAATRKLVYEFLDEELAPAARAPVARHLAECPPCAGYFTFERAYLLVVKRKTTIEAAPPELRDRLRAELAARGRSRPAN